MHNKYTFISIDFRKKLKDGIELNIRKKNRIFAILRVINELSPPNMANTRKDAQMTVTVYEKK